MPDNFKKVKPLEFKSTPRATSNARGYDTQHKKLRKMLLAKYPICQLQYEGCKGFSTQAHHKVYKPVMRLEDYMAICSSCHSKIHRGGQ